MISNNCFRKEMRRCWKVVVGVSRLSLLLLVAFCWTTHPAAAIGDALDEGKVRVLVITGGHDFEQVPFRALFESLPNMVSTQVSYPAAAELLRPNLAKDYDVVVFYDLWAKGMSPAQQEAFIALLDHGIGVVALHHTLAAHPNWPAYAEIIGGKYHLQDRVVDGQTIPKSGFSHGQDIQVHVADSDHPITRGLEDFEIHDETYNRYDIAADARVLLTTDHPQSDAELAWVKTFRHSRVFYLQLGHDHAAYENPHYRKLLARGIRWAAGRPADPSLSATSLFNGRDLTGWKAEGGASWEVKDGLLIGKQGPQNAPGDLFSEASFDDLELKVTFRVEWPANSGVWYRYQSARQAYQADILEYQDPFALTGTLYCTGKMFLAVNEDPQLVHREDWNTIVIRAVGNRQVLFLNGKQVVDVRDDTSDYGRVGFQVHAGSQFAKMRILVKEITVRRI